MAREIHRSLVPTFQRKLAGYEISGASIPSGEVGGDLVDIAERSNGPAIYANPVISEILFTASGRGNRTYFASTGMVVTAPAGVARMPRMLICTPAGVSNSTVSRLPAANA